MSDSSIRKNLRKINNQRTKFFATVGRFGTRLNWHGFPEKTVCFVDVRDTNNNLMTDHIWFCVGKRISELDLKEGDKVSFEARVGSYIKGYVNDREFIDERKEDYKLNNPTKIVKIGN